MRRRKQIPFLVDEESVAVERVVKPALRRRLVQGINNGTNGQGQGSIVRTRTGRVLCHNERSWPANERPGHQKAHNRAAERPHPVTRISPPAGRAIDPSASPFTAANEISRPAICVVATEEGLEESLDFRLLFAYCRSR